MLTTRYVGRKVKIRLTIGKFTLNMTIWIPE